LFCGIAEHASKITSRWEVIFIDDGSSGGSWEVIRQLAFENPNHVAAIKFRRNMGKADALAAGWEECKGDLVFTMDTNLHQHSERAKTKPIVARVSFSNRSSLSRLSGHRLLAGGESSFAWGVLTHDLGYWLRNCVCSVKQEHWAKLFGHRSVASLDSIQVGGGEEVWCLQRRALIPRVGNE
jgi:glycosyltransferase involved in cell wall biosynthesis